MPRVRPPQAGERLMIEISYPTRAVAERQAAVWNEVFVVDHLQVAVGPSNEDNEWPLVWEEVRK